MRGRNLVVVVLSVTSMLAVPVAGRAESGVCQARGIQTCTVTAASPKAVLVGFIPAFEGGLVSLPEATFVGPGVDLEWQEGEVVDEVVDVDPGEEYVLTLYAGGNVSVATGATEDDEGRLNGFAPGSCTVQVTNDTTRRCQVTRADASVGATVVGTLPAGSVVDLVARSYGTWADAEVIETWGPYGSGIVLDETVTLDPGPPVELEVVLDGDGAVVLSSGPLDTGPPGSPTVEGDIISPVTTETDGGLAACGEPRYESLPDPPPADGNQQFVISTANLPAGIDAGEFEDAVIAAATAWNSAETDCGVTVESPFNYTNFEVISDPLPVWDWENPLAEYPNGVGFLHHLENNFIGWDLRPCNPVDNPCYGLKWPSFPSNDPARRWSVVLNPDLIGDLNWSLDPTADEDLVLPWLLADDDEVDLLSVVTHEFGHVSGLGHPDISSDPDNIVRVVDPSSHLTMLSYTKPGETMKRTLGLGELLYLSGLSP